MKLPERVRYGRQGLAPRKLKRIIRGVITLTVNTTSGTFAIPAIDPDNSVLSYLHGSSNYNSSETRYQKGRLSLSSMQVTLTRTATASVGDSISASFEIREYYPGYLRSVQRGTLLNSGSLAVTAAIGRVVPERASLDSLGWTGDSNAWVGYTGDTYLKLDSAVQISSNFQTWNGGGTALTHGWQVCERA